MTPLALLHPSGRARSALVLGEAQQLAAGLPQAGADEDADVIVVGPGAGDVSAALQARLAPGGVVYFATRQARHVSGLETVSAYLHLGERAHPRFLVPVRTATARWAVSHLSSSPRARIGMRVPRLMRALAPGALACRPGVALAAWLDVDVRDVVLSRSAALVLDGGALAAVAKPVATERDALARFAPAARAAGAAVPDVIRDEPALVLSGLPGTPASIQLARTPQRLPGFLADLSAWLSRWNRATAVDATLTEELLSRRVLAQARRAGVDAAYERWLEDRCTELTGAPVKLVAAHNDLTTANVLVDGDAALGIVDWEVAQEGCLPLTDLFYAAADAHAAATRFADTPAAFRSSLADRALSDELGLDPAVADLCFHACWLGHAANEAAAGDGDHRFRTIVATIGRERIRMAA